MRNWIATARHRGLIARLSMLSLAMLAVYGVAAPVAAKSGGGGGLLASASAGGVCLLGAAAALIATRAMSRPGNSLRGVLLAMPLRMGIPLFGAVALQVFVKSLADAHLLIYLLVFYPVALFVETFLALPGAGAPRDQGDATGKAAS